MKINKLIEEYGKTYSSLLGIDLEKGSGKEIFKWWIASLFFGARISESIAIKTYKEFEKAGLAEFKDLCRASQGRLIRILGKGGYARYDGLTSEKLMRMCRKLKQEYGGKITNIHKKAKNPEDLENRLQEFWRVGPVTTNIFLRELRMVWEKANPEPLPHIRKTAKRLKINLNRLNKKSKKFIQLECALHRAWRESK
jgi:hypothetical protein